jgi:flagellar FliJ protein
MAKFIFKLESLLKQRKREEQECQRLLAEQAAVVNAAEEAVRRINQTVQDGHDNVRRHLMGKLDMGFLTAHRRFMGAMQRQVAELMQKVVVAKNRMEEARTRLAEAARRHKAIQKLREKQFDRWRTDQARWEAAQSDEIGNQLAYHNLLLERVDGDQLEGVVE